MDRLVEYVSAPQRKQEYILQNLFIILIRDLRELIQQERHTKYDTKLCGRCQHECVLRMHLMRNNRHANSIILY